MKKLITLFLFISSFALAQVELTYGPYATLAAAKSAIPQAVRYAGLTVHITGLGHYCWLAGDFSDNGLIVKESDLSTTKAPIASPTFTGTVNGITATMVGLGNVTNESKATMFTNATFTGTFSAGINNNASYRTILQASGSHIATKVAGTYAIGQGDPLAVSGTGTLYPLAVIQIVSADYPTINGITTKLRIRAQLFTNDVAPTGNFTFGLYPITRPATSGGAGLCIYTLGTVVTGSNGATFTTPAADLLGSAVSSDFTLPADGPYVIGVVTTGTIATSALVQVVAQLQLRNN